MAVNPDFRDLLSIFNDEGVEYLVVGAHAVMYYTEPRYTKDIDIWVRPSPENAQRVFRALVTFGAPMAVAEPESFTDPDLAYQIGVARNRIDIIMGVEGIEFEPAWQRRVPTTYGDVPTHVLCKEDVMRSKRAAGRPQDLLDLEKLR